MHIYFNKLLVILIAYLAVGCSKNSGLDQFSSSDKISLTFDLRGVKGVVETLKSSTFKSASINPLIQQNDVNNFYVEGEFDFYVSQASYEAVDLKNKSKKFASKPAYPDNYDPIGSTIVSPLQNSVYYRVLVYKASDNSYVGSITNKVGDVAPRLDVNYDTEYNWYAYSFNSTEAFETGANDVEFMIENKDLLYDSGTITTTVLGDNKIAITFEHMMAAVEVTGYTIGFSAEPDLTNFGADASNPLRSFMNFANLRIGKFNLLLGNFDATTITTTNDYNKTLVHTKTVTNKHMSDPDYPFTSIRGYVYSVPSSTNINTTISAKLGIKMHYKDTTRLIEPATAIPVNDLKLTAGRLSRIGIMPFDRGIEVGATEWSKGYMYQVRRVGTTPPTEIWSENEQLNWFRHLVPNLYQMGPSPHVSYGERSFHEHKLYNGLLQTSRYDVRKYFWYWQQNALGWGEIGANSATPEWGDPCLNDHTPKGLKLNNTDIPRRWRMPTYDEGVALKNSINASGAINKFNHATVGTVSYYQITHYPNPANASTTDGWWNGGIVIPLDGWRKNGSQPMITCCDNFDGQNATQGWRGSASNSSTGVIKEAAYIRLVDPVPGNIRTYSSGNYPGLSADEDDYYSAVLRVSYDSEATPKIQAEIVNLPYLSGATVRCVRNK